MSERERSDTGAITESPTLLPAHGGAETASNGTRDRTNPPGADTTATNSAATDTTNNAADSTSAAAGAAPALGPDGLPKKRRRRGSRGGRGRKKPGTAGG